MLWCLRFSSGLFFSFPVCRDKMQKRCDPTMSPLLLVREYVFAYADAKENQINNSQFSWQFKMPFISLHSKPLLLPPPLLFPLFLLFYSSCIISHLHNFWRSRILLINLNNKDGPFKETRRQPFHRLDWRGLGCLCQRRFHFCSVLRSLVLLIIMFKDS